MSNGKVDVLADIIKLLHEKTKNNKIEWNIQGEGLRLVAETEISGNKLEMSYFTEGDAFDLVLKVFNSESILTDTIRDTELTGMVPAPVGSRGWYTYMKEIIEEAQRQSSGADEVLESIFSALSKY